MSPLFTFTTITFGHSCVELLNTSVIECVCNCVTGFWKRDLIAQNLSLSYGQVSLMASPKFAMYTFQF